MLNKNIPIRLIPLFIGISIILISCSSYRAFPFGQKASMKELTHCAIFKYLSSPNTMLKDVVGKGLIKLDPDLFVRDSLTIYGKTYFNAPMHSPSLKLQKFKKNFKLVIPDSLANQYIYTTGESDYEHDYAIIIQFSPLLPTQEKNIYFMERYMWSNMCDEEMCVRALSRSFLSFKITGNDLILQPNPPFINQADFIGFGPFSRKKMDEALPGEKIARFRLEPKSRG